MARLQPLRDGDLQDRTTLRTRLNEAFQRLNDNAARWATRRIPNVQTGMQVIAASPGFTVGAVTIGGVNATNGGAKPTAAPWIDDFTQQTDGRITFTVGGLGAAPSLYAVNVIFYEAEAA